MHFSFILFLTLWLPTVWHLLMMKFMIQSASMIFWNFFGASWVDHEIVNVESQMGILSPQSKNRELRSVFCVSKSTTTES